MKSIKNFLKDESGQGLVEYGLIMGLIVLAALGALTLLGSTVKTVLYEHIFEKISEVVSDL